MRAAAVVPRSVERARCTALAGQPEQGPVDPLRLDKHNLMNKPPPGGFFMSKANGKKQK